MGNVGIIISTVTKFLITTLLFLNVARAESTLYCTHLQICNSLKFLLGENYNYRLALKPKGDPHHYEINASEMKQILKAKPLFYNSIIRPKLKKFLQEKEETFDTAFQGTGEHFWTTPQQLENYLNSLAQLLKEKKFQVKDGLDLQALSSFPNLKDETVILSHNAFHKLFKGLGAEILILSGDDHGHHHEVNLGTLKKLEIRLKKNKPIIWVFEKEIGQVLAIKRKVRSQDQVIDLDVMGKLGDSPWKPLEILHKALKSETDRKGQKSSI